MVKKGVLVIALLLISFLLSGCSLSQKQAALQINTTPTANVFVDGKLLGKTPYSSSELKAGEATIKLIPESITEVLTSWEGKVKLTGGILTLIDREFAASEANASGQVLNLEKIKDKNAAQISIITEPDGVLAKIDGETKGFSPLNVDGISVGDHEIVLSKDGYNNKVLKVKNVLGYRLIINAKLGQTEPGGPIPTPTLPDKQATTSPAKVTSTPSPEIAKPYVLIKDTETGFLRVRNAPVSGAEVARVKPGEKYPYIESNSDDSWYKIEYQTDKEGWISASYAQKVE